MKPNGAFGLLSVLIILASMLEGSPAAAASRRSPSTDWNCTPMNVLVRVTTMGPLPMDRMSYATLARSFRPDLLLPASR